MSYKQISDLQDNIENLETVLAQTVHAGKVLEKALENRDIEIKRIEAENEELRTMHNIMENHYLRSEEDNLILNRENLSLHSKVSEARSILEEIPWNIQTDLRDRIFKFLEL